MATVGVKGLIFNRV